MEITANTRGVWGYAKSVLKVEAKIDKSALIEAKVDNSATFKTQSDTKRKISIISLREAKNHTF